jgi:sortase A
MRFAFLKVYYRVRFIRRKIRINKTVIIRKLLRTLRLRSDWIDTKINTYKINSYKLKHSSEKILSQKRLKYNIMIIFILILAVQQLGQGGYIYAKAVLAQYLIESAWQKTLSGEQRVKPWSWADTWPVAKLTASKFSTELFILAGDNGRTLAFGPGYRFGSELPGTSGTSIISGHRDTHFSFLRDIGVFDEFEIQNNRGEVSRYRVNQTKIVSIDDDFVIQEDDSTRITLVTCYPFESIIPGGKLRYIVSAIKLGADYNEAKKA